VIRQRVGAPRAGDVDLNRDQIGLIVGSDRPDVLVEQRGLVVRVQVCREGGEPQRLLRF
jgi:hypothetical protein